MKARFPHLQRSSPNHSRGLTRLGLWGCRVLALVWAAGWIAFTAQTVWGQGWDQTLLGTVSGAAVLVPVMLAWMFPRFGGLVLVGLGVCAKLWADSQTAIVGLAVPGVALGTAFILLGTSAAFQRWRTRRKALKIARTLDRS
ncbi:hypothetical protein MNBD_PLANCTO03-1344 [hydrothermal vent metagenome]|uniref:Uncharacterized protein n=1 Tax=hydrothermal vent metagenome TaxID=652676 RepID=A0A3B1E783_9ZZZZ